MTQDESTKRVLQMRLVVEVEDYDEAVAFYRDVLGAREELVVDSEGGASVTILDVGRATLELSNPAQVALIDDVEVGRRVSPRMRVAFEVTDAASVTRDLVAGGADLIAEPILTPWQSLNARLTAPAGLQITVFQETGDDS
jgi:lactoylglutathione lyase